MKTKIAMAISIAGVLVAGSAAALVNTQVLGSNTSATPVLADSGQTLPTNTTTVTVAPAVTTPTTLPVATTPTTPPTPASVAPAVSATQAVFTAGDAGTVTLDTTGDVLTIVGVVPTEGWTVTKSENEDSQNVEVKFQAGAIEVEFHANLQFGIVTPSVETKDESVSSNSVDDNGGGHGGDDDSGRHGGGDD